MDRTKRVVHEQRRLGRGARRLRDGAAPPARRRGATAVHVAQPMLPIVGSERGVPGAPHLLHRPQLRRARARDGLGPDREPPFFFQKPSDAVQFVALGTAADHPYPPLTKNYHYEIELVAALKSGGRNIPIDAAPSTSSTATRSAST